MSFESKMMKKRELNLPKEIDLERRAKIKLYLAEKFGLNEVNARKVCSIIDREQLKISELVVGNYDNFLVSLINEMCKSNMFHDIDFVHIRDQEKRENIIFGEDNNANSRTLSPEEIEILRKQLEEQQIARERMQSRWRNRRR